MDVTVTFLETFLNMLTCTHKKDEVAIGCQVYRWLHVSRAIEKYNNLVLILENVLEFMEYIKKPL